MSKQIIKPFELLLEYERRSLAHALGGGSDEETAEDWSGIGFKVGENHLVSLVDDINEVVILPDLIMRTLWAICSISDNICVLIITVL